MRQENEGEFSDLSDKELFELALEVAGEPTYTEVTPQELLDKIKEAGYLINLKGGSMEADVSTGQIKQQDPLYSMEYATYGESTSTLIGPCDVFIKAIIKSEEGVGSADETTLNNWGIK